MTARSNAIFATAAFGCLLLAGCAEGSLGSAFNTGSIDPQKQAAAEQAEKSKQALCATLVSQIEALNNEGVSDKVAKAAAKKYKLKSGDLAKADELNKANTEFQSKCSSYPPRIASTAPVDPVTTGSVAAAGTAKTATATKAKPPVPTQKPVAAAMAPQETTASAATTPAIPNP